MAKWRERKDCRQFKKRRRDVPFLTSRIKNLSFLTNLKEVNGGNGEEKLNSYYCEKLMPIRNFNNLYSIMNINGGKRKSSRWPLGEKTKRNSSERALEANCKFNLSFLVNITIVIVILFVVMLNETIEMTTTTTTTTTPTSGQSNLSMLSWSIKLASENKKKTNWPDITKLSPNVMLSSTETTKGAKLSSSSNLIGDVSLAIQLKEQEESERKYFKKSPIGSETKQLNKREQLNVRQLDEHHELLARLKWKQQDKRKGAVFVDGPQSFSAAGDDDNKSFQWRGSLELREQLAIDKTASNQMINDYKTRMQAEAGTYKQIRGALKSPSASAKARAEPEAGGEEAARAVRSEKQMRKLKLLSKLGEGGSPSPSPSSSSSFEMELHKMGDKRNRTKRSLGTTKPTQTSQPSYKTPPPAAAADDHDEEQKLPLSARRPLGAVKTLVSNGSPTDNKLNYNDSKNSIKGGSGGRQIGSATNTNENSLQFIIVKRDISSGGGTRAAAASATAPSASRNISKQATLNKQQQIQEQAYQRGRTLMEKYMTNRALNDRVYYILLVIYSLFIIIGTISNSLICLTVILKPKILSPRNIFIFNLATSDLLLCVFTMPFSFIEISMKMWQMGVIPCKLVAGLQATSIFVSTISITAIALDRYRVIVYPTHQESSNGIRNAVLLLAFVWFGALLLSLPLFSFRTVEHWDLPLNYDTIKSIDFCVEAWPFAHGRGIYSVISMIFQYVLPITIVSVVYAKISDKLQKRLIRRQKLTQLECQQKKQLNLIRRTHTMLISVSLIFGLSWLPLNLLNLIGDFTDLFGGDDQLFRIVFAICHLIGCSSACSNPILYGYLNENFRKEFHQVYTHHAHQLIRFLRRSICARLVYICGGRKLDMMMTNYMASSSSTIYSTSSHSSSSSSSSHDSNDDEDNSNSNSNSAAMPQSNDNSQLIEDAYLSQTEGSESDESEQLAGRNFESQKEVLALTGSENSKHNNNNNNPLASVVIQMRDVEENKIMSNSDKNKQKEKFGNETTSNHIAGPNCDGDQRQLEQSFSYHLSQAKSNNQCQSINYQRQQQQQENSIDNQQNNNNRKGSFQALASAGRQKGLDKSMRFCLCISGLSSSDSLQGACEPGSRPSSIRQHSYHSESSKLRKSKELGEQLEREDDCDHADADGKKMAKSKEELSKGRRKRKRRKKITTFLDSDGTYHDHDKSQVATLSLEKQNKVSLELRTLQHKPEAPNKQQETDIMKSVANNDWSPKELTQRLSSNSNYSYNNNNNNNNNKNDSTTNSNSVKVKENGGEKRRRPDGERAKRGRKSSDGNGGKQAACECRCHKQQHQQQQHNSNNDKKLNEKVKNFVFPLASLRQSLTMMNSNNNNNNNNRSNAVNNNNSCNNKRTSIDNVVGVITNMVGKFSTGEPGLKQEQANITNANESQQQQQQHSGKRVWLRFFPTKDRYSNVSADNLAAKSLSMIRKEKQFQNEYDTDKSNNNINSSISRKKPHKSKRQSEKRSVKRRKRHCSSCKHNHGSKLDKKSSSRRRRADRMQKVSSNDGGIKVVLNNKNNTCEMENNNNKISSSSLVAVGCQKEPKNLASRIITTTTDINKSPLVQKTTASGFVEGLPMGEADNKVKNSSHNKNNTAHDDKTIIDRHSNVGSNNKRTIITDNDNNRNKRKLFGSSGPNGGHNNNSNNNNNNSNATNNLTGKYFLSVETARRKESLELTSTSRERTSTSVVIFNGNEFDSSSILADDFNTGNGVADRQEKSMASSSEENNNLNTSYEIDDDDVNNNNNQNHNHIDANKGKELTGTNHQIGNEHYEKMNIMLDDIDKEKLNELSKRAKLFSEVSQEKAQSQLKEEDEGEELAKSPSPTSQPITTRMTALDNDNEAKTNSHDCDCEENIKSKKELLTPSNDDEEQKLSASCCPFANGCGHKNNDSIPSSKLIQQYKFADENVYVYGAIKADIKSSVEERSKDTNRTADLSKQQTITIDDEIDECHSSSFVCLNSHTSSCSCSSITSSLACQLDEDQMIDSTNILTTQHELKSNTKLGSLAALAGSLNNLVDNNNNNNSNKDNNKTNLNSTTVPSTITSTNATFRKQKQTPQQLLPMAEGIVKGLNVSTATTATTTTTTTTSRSCSTSVSGSITNSTSNSLNSEFMCSSSIVASPTSSSQKSSYSFEVAKVMCNSQRHDTSNNESKKINSFKTNFSNRHHGSCNKNDNNNYRKNSAPSCGTLADDLENNVKNCRDRNNKNSINKKLQNGFNVTLLSSEKTNPDQQKLTNSSKQLVSSFCGPDNEENSIVDHASGSNDQ